MLRKTVVAVSGLAGSVVEGLEVGVFGGIAANTLPDYLFKPLSATIAAASVAGPFVEESVGKKAWRVLGYAPAIAANVAAFAFEGPTAVAIFTGAVGATGMILAAEMGYKKYQGEDISKVEWVEFAGKMAKVGMICFTLNYQGTGKVMEFAKQGAVPLAHKVSAGMVAGLAGIGAKIGFFKHGKALVEVVKEIRNRPASTDYQLMADDIESSNRQSIGEMSTMSQKL